MFELPAALLLFAFTASNIQAQETARTSTIASTCPSRSVNYITHSLPQQCLTASWTSRVSQVATSNEAVQTSSVSATSIQTVQTTHGVNFTPQLASMIESPSLLQTYSSEVPPTSATEVLKEPAATLEADQETDSPLDNANFLSFEDWKRQNLAKVGQSAENLGVRTGKDESRRRPGGINNALDSLGEDTEIEIDFGGFVNPRSPGSGSPLAASGMESDGSVAETPLKEPTAVEEPSGARRKGKDAGKTCKERSNYASFDCAATVLKTNSESKGSTAVLVENKDSYMLNICSAKNKFFIVELCDDILIDTVVIANFEFFSSMFRTFRVSVSDRYPVKLDKWKDIGTFEARNSREVQAFLVENPLIWARYLRIEFLSHFGNEYYCPVSLLRVHGTTMMEEFNHDLKRAGTEDESDNDIGENDEGEDVSSISGVVTAEALKEQTQQTSKQAEAASQTFSTATPVATMASLLSQPTVEAANTPIASDIQAVQPIAFAPHNFSISKQMEDILSAVDKATERCRLQDEPHISSKPRSVVSTPPESFQSTVSTKTTNEIESVLIQTFTPMNHATSSKETKPADTSPLPNSERMPLSEKSEQPKQSTQVVASSGKVPISATQPPNANPTTQESFFKSVHKRLQLLESNSTLSLQYIEEQSRILRDAFSKVEKRQLAKTTTFLETLNTTVLTELRDFRSQYDQIWQSTVLELSSQREQSQHEVFALSARLGLLADEIVLQKRIAIVQFLLILLCLGLAVFSRTGSAVTYSELPPLVQNAIHKSSVSLSRYASHFETPPASPPSTRPSSGYGLFRDFSHRRSPSDDSHRDRTRDGTKSPEVEYFPPSPISPGSPEDPHDLITRADGEENSNEGSLQAIANAKQMERSPVTPTGWSERQGGLVDRNHLRPDSDHEVQATCT